MKLTTDGEMYVIRGRRFIRWTRLLLLMAGILALGYVGLTLLGARSYQAAANQTLDRQIEDEEVFPASLSRTAGREGEVIGRIEIPRLGLAVAILEGTASRTLRAGVGHIAGTALPGETGNIGIAGHRDTYFRTLKDILPGDEIRIQTPTGLSRYEVNWVQIVSPNDAGILAHSPDSAVTLVTCYPFYYVGPAPERYVVHARKMRTPAESPAAETSGMAPTHKE